MRAMILAAGRGTRLASSHPDRPKILAPLADAPLLHWQFAYLAHSGVTQVAINVHHMAGQVLEAVARQSVYRNVVTVFEPELRGTAGALLGLGEFATEPFIVLLGDVLTNFPLPALWERHRSSGALATLVCHVAAETAGKGLIELDPQERVVLFAEKPGDRSCSARQYVNAGIHCVDPKLLELIEDGDDLGFDTWPRALQAGLSLAGQVTESYVRDIGTADSLRAADDDLRRGVLRW